jgi:hypothetical protein
MELELIVVAMHHTSTKGARSLGLRSVSDEGPSAPHRPADCSIYLAACAGSACITQSWQLFVTEHKLCLAQSDADAYLGLFGASGDGP